MTVYSLDARQAGYAETTDGFWITLLTFSHPDLPEPVLLSSDRTQRITDDPLVYGTVSRGDNYLWVPMGVLYPGDDGQSAPEFKIVLDAIDREMFAVIRASATPATAKIETVWWADVDTPEETYDGFEVQSAPYDISQITVVLGTESFWGESWPNGRMTPKSTPGLHR